MAFRKRVRHEANEPLQITSLMDILMILLFYLLMNFSSEPPYTPSAELKLPNSTARQKSKPAVTIVASNRAISVGKTRVATICQDEIYPPDIQCSASGASTNPGARLGDRVIPALQAALKDEADNAKELAKLREDKKFEGHLILEAHFALPFKVLKSIMYTAGQSEFGLFKFSVIEVEKKI